MQNEMIIRFIRNRYIRKNTKGFCELTTEMDEYLLSKTDYDGYRTYMYDFGSRETNYYDCEKGHVYLMRLPGATRGCIVTDENNRIEFIRFYEDTCYEKFHDYDRAMENIKEKYIGRKVVVEIEGE